MVGLTVEQTLASGGVTAGILVVSTFCWCWRLRCRRKTALLLIDKLGEMHLSREPPAWPAPVVVPETPDATLDHLGPGARRQ